MFESKLLTVARFVFDNHQKVSQEDIVKKFGIADYDRFRQVFGSKYAESMDVGGKKILRLTEEGMQLYLDLKGKEQQEILNKLMVIATVILALAAIVQIFK